MKIKDYSKKELQRQFKYYHYSLVGMSALITIFITTSCLQLTIVGTEKIQNNSKQSLWFPFENQNASTLAITKFNACRPMAPLEGMKVWDCLFRAETPAYVPFLNDQKCRYIESTPFTKGISQYTVLCARDMYKINRTIGAL